MSRVATKAEKPAGSPANSRRVLVLDAHPGDRARMAELLRQAGYLVLEAGFAVQLTPLTSALSPALCVIDIFLAGPSGADVIRQLRGTPAFAETPILAVSASGTLEIRHLALAAGATAFLEKPLDPKSFLDTVAHLVGKPPARGGVARGQTPTP